MCVVCSLSARAIVAGRAPLRFGPKVRRLSVQSLNFASDQMFVICYLRQRSRADTPRRDDTPTDSTVPGILFEQRDAKHDYTW